MDTSCLVAVALGEPAGSGIPRRLRQFDRCIASNLLEAELRSALAREGIAGGVDPLLEGVDWILPARPLTQEFRRVLRQGYCRGADLWHLGCALHIAPDPEDLVFLTLDERQGALARRLGFRT